jgi:hypothetical protein
MTPNLLGRAIGLEPGNGNQDAFPATLSKVSSYYIESFLLLPLLRVRAIMALVEVAMDRRDVIYAEFGVPPEEPEDPLDRWRRMKAEREEPQPRERKLDTAPFTLDDVDRRIGEWIAAERERTRQFLIEFLVQLQSDAEMRGPPGPAGPQGGRRSVRTVQDVRFLLVILICAGSELSVP